MLHTTDCPVFEVKAKINESVPSDVINRSKSIDYSTQTDSYLWPIQKLEQDLTMLQKTAFKYLDFLGIYANVVFSVEPRKVDG